MPKANKQNKSINAAASPHQGLPLFARQVLDAVDQIPPGRVVSYGDIAEYIGGAGPRMVARMMTLYGQESCWWRVIRNDGSCAGEVSERQYPLLSDEGVAFRPSGRVDMAVARFVFGTS